MMCSYRRRPFLSKSLESTLIKLLRSLDFYDEEGRQKIAIGKTFVLLLLCAATGPFFLALPEEH